MKWFKHESDSHSNIKLQAVIDEFGVAAYGYYWACVELVASQGENYRIKREKRWDIYLKKMLNIEIEQQKTYLVFFARNNLIDKDSLKKGDLYIPKLSERSDEYTAKVRRKSGHTMDNVGLEQNRTEKNREERLSASLTYLFKIPDGDMQEFLGRFDVSEKGIRSKAEDLALWCKANGKVKKDYKSTLLNALKKDFPEKKAQGQKSAPAPERAEKLLTPEQEEERRIKIAEIRSDLQNIGVIKK